MKKNNVFYAKIIEMKRNNYCFEPHKSANHKRVK